MTLQIGQHHQDQTQPPACFNYLEFVLCYEATKWLWAGNVSK